ncbi:Secretory lipase [Nocardioides terrae]|uniref:Secretory lipase n=1 Tax=Nocardioides terrae TaxID=574651 RepID=A0A1I1L4B3_9ACTN|nr:lipase family protein [Nocardioides terrae]SFC67805.1 Secretory lipase [Nocardioides terrae]
MSLRIRAAFTAAAATAVLAPSMFTAANAAPVPPPSQDPFYATAAQPDAAPGDVIDHRDVALPGLGSATQLLYRTTDEQRHPSTTVTTVLNPAGAATKGIVAYLSFYDGLGEVCDPSYTLQGGGNGPGQEAQVIGLLVQQGYAVTVPDFEGRDHHWAAGDESGWSTLDAIRATEQQLGVSASTKVALAGYSGGSIAGEWATELAPTYAPELNLVGTAIGGVPADLGHVVSYTNGSAAWAGVIPAAMVSLGRAFDIDFTPYLTQRGLDDTDAIKDSCIADFNAAESGVRLSDLLKPEYASFLDIPVVDGIVNHLRMGTHGTPKAPMMMVNGNADGTGDGVMVAADVKALADRYCAKGVTVSYTELPGATHTAAGQTFVFSALAYIADRFAGKAAPSTCPVPAPKPAGPKSVTASIKGHSKAHRDVVVVTAPGAVGAKVALTRFGRRGPVARGTIGADGTATISVADHNGSRRTRYRAVVGATSATRGTTTRVLKLR